MPEKMRMTRMTDRTPMITYRLKVLLFCRICTNNTTASEGVNSHVVDKLLALMLLLPLVVAVGTAGNAVVATNFVTVLVRGWHWSFCFSQKHQAQRQAVVKSLPQDQVTKKVVQYNKRVHAGRTTAPERPVTFIRGST